MHNLVRGIKHSPYRLSLDPPDDPRLSLSLSSTLAFHPARIYPFGLYQPQNPETKSVYARREVRSYTFCCQVCASTVSYGSRADISTPSFPPQTRGVSLSCLEAYPVCFSLYTHRDRVVLLSSSLSEDQYKGAPQFLLVSRIRTNSGQQKRKRLN